MPGSEPRILAAAWEDLSAIADAHVRLAVPASARKVTDRLLDSIDLLSDMPELAPLHQDPVLSSKGCRKLMVSPYVVIYRVIDGVPTVYRVFHGGSDFGARL